MTATPDWIYRTSADGATFETPSGWTTVLHSADSLWEISQEEVKSVDHPGTFYIDATAIPMDSKLAHRGVKGVLQQVTPVGDIKAIVHLRRGLFGWFARRWLRDHPLQYTGEMYRPEWGEWRNVTGKVEVS